MRERWQNLPRAVKVALVVVAGLVLLTVVGPYVDDVNPEDEIHFNQVVFVNDMPAPVEFGMCEDTCDDLYFDEELAPGEKSDVQQVSNEDVSTSVLVRQHGRAASCVTIRLTTPRDETLTVPLSAARSCQDLLTR